MIEPNRAKVIKIFSLHKIVGAIDAAIKMSKYKNKLYFLNFYPRS